MLQEAWAQDIMKRRPDLMPHPTLCFALCIRRHEHCTQKSMGCGIRSDKSARGHQVHSLCQAMRNKHAWQLATETASAQWSQPIVAMLCSIMPSGPSIRSDTMLCEQVRRVRVTLWVACQDVVWLVSKTSTVQVIKKLCLLGFSGACAWFRPLQPIVHTHTLCSDVTKRLARDSCEHLTRCTGLRVTVVFGLRTGLLNC